MTEKEDYKTLMNVNNSLNVKKIINKFNDVF
jgi:hypothetical protein